MKRMWRITAYLAFFCGVFLLVFSLISAMQSPEKRIIGNWVETAWEYERTAKGSDILPDRHLPEELRDEITGKLLIHTAETWQFFSDGTLILRKKDGAMSHLHWKLKGRGHVLQVCLPGSDNEYYDIGELNDSSLLLYIDTDVQAKGIVRLQFTKTP